MDCLVPSLAQSSVPLVALNGRTLNVLKLGLNPLKVLPSPKGYSRDWRGLAQILNIPDPPCEAKDPAEYMMAQWKLRPDATVMCLIKALEEMDRYDVIDDMIPFLDEDVRKYSEKSNGTAHALCSNSDSLILTADDAVRFQRGLDPQTYDAFLLYSDEDADFAQLVVDKLENEYGLKLCLKDRDLVGGLQFEHEAIMRLINNRCTRLIPILSETFLKSSENKFFVLYAQALGIEQRVRKIVPCICKKMQQRHPELSHYHVLDYTRSSAFANFWERLRDSIVVASAPAPNRHLSLPAPPRSVSTSDKCNQPCASHSEWMPEKTIPESRSAAAIVQVEQSNELCNKNCDMTNESLDLPTPPSDSPSRSNSSIITRLLRIRKKKKTKIKQYT